MIRRFPRGKRACPRSSPSQLLSHMPPKLVFVRPSAGHEPAGIVSSHSEKNRTFRSFTPSGSFSLTHVSIVCLALELEHKGNQGLLLLLIQLQAQNKVEKLHRIVKRQESAIMQVRRRILDAAQG